MTLKLWVACLIFFSGLTASACSRTIRHPTLYKCPVYEIGPHLYVTSNSCVLPNAKRVWIDQCDGSIRYTEVLPTRWTHTQFPNFTAVFLADYRFVNKVNLYTYSSMPALLRKLARWFSRTL